MTQGVDIEYHFAKLLQFYLRQGDVYIQMIHLRYPSHVQREDARTRGMAKNLIHRSISAICRGHSGRQLISEASGLACASVFDRVKRRLSRKWGSDRAVLPPKSHLMSEHFARQKRS